MVQHERRDLREVGRGQGLGASGITRFDRIRDLFVRGDDARPQVRDRPTPDCIGVVGPRLLVERPQALECADDDHQRRVAASVDDRLMELFEHPCSPGHVLRFDGPAPDVQLAQVRNERHVPIGSLRAMCRARRFDHGQRRREIVERDLTSLQDEPERTSGVLRSGRVDLRAPDVASPHGDEALALQDPERLPE